MKSEIRQLDFSDQEIYVGIDVHRKSWRTTIHLGEFQQKTINLSPPSPESLSEYLRRHYPNGKYLCAYEAGYCGFWVQEQLIQQGIETVVVHPADIPTTDHERQHKDDVRDSRKIARALRNGELKGIFIPTKRQQQDRALVRRRFSIASDRRRAMTRIKMYLHFLGLYPPQGVMADWTWTKTFIQWLERQAQHDQVLTSLLDEYAAVRQRERVIVKQLHQLFSSDYYASQMKLLRSVSGVGFYTAIQLLTEIGDMRRFTTLDKLCAYLGLVPKTHRSGDTDQAKRRTNRGNKRLRSALIECSWKAIQQDSELSLCYLKLRKRFDGPHAIIKISRKVLNRIRRVWLTGQPYTPIQNT
ncbi:MAG: IS110 family transposase [Lewinellaceae bacterium]|nr:IS110 family transposase [candidate division KSB1 bacterium]MCB0533317.1 IS110 family transposase [Saprospiraceae bacterium]MCB9317233.1 IS110 family transposase [Lewinellaceae bacterium]MCB9331484.1 IS110 family transposase [Lewinellaceae bacterium]